MWPVSCMFTSTPEWIDIETSAGRSQDCSDSTVRGTEQASQDPPEDVSANSSTPECPRENGDYAFIAAVFNVLFYV